MIREHNKSQQDITTYCIIAIHVTCQYTVPIRAKVANNTCTLQQIRYYFSFKVV